MALWRTKPHQFVVVQLEQQTLSWLVGTGEYPELKLELIQTMELAKSVVHDLVIYNPTQLRQIFQQLVTKHQLQRAHWGLILAGPSLREQLNSVDHSLVAHKFVQVYQHDPAQHWFYAAQLPVGLVWQYQLLFIQQQLNLTGITSPNGALLELLKLPDFTYTGNLTQLVQIAPPAKRSLAMVNQWANLAAVTQRCYLASLGLYLTWCNRTVSESKSNA